MRFMTLDEYMKKYGIKPAELAAETGLSIPYIYKLLNGERFPKPKTMDRLNKATQGKITYNSFYRQEAGGA